MTDEDHWEKVATAWTKWWPLIEAGARPVGQTMLDLVALKPGERVLDLASGIGEPAALAAERVGPTGHVIATDLAPTMVALGRARVARLGLTNIEFRQMDASAPDLPGGSFDVALCRWGLMFIDDLEGTLSRLHDLLAPGGRLAIAVWGPPEEVPAISLATRVLRRELDLAPPAEGTATPFDLADIDALTQTLGAAGFKAIENQPVSVVYDFASDEEYLGYRRDLSPPDPAMARIPEARRAAAWQAVGEALAPYRTAEGRVVMENLSICLAAWRD